MNYDPQVRHSSDCYIDDGWVCTIWCVNRLIRRLADAIERDTVPNHPDRHLVAEARRSLVGLRACDD